MLQLWSPFILPPSSTNSHSDRPVYTPEEYINLVLRNGHIMSHDYTHQSTEEDPRMMAFFDSLVQGEVELVDDTYGSTEEELSSDEEELFELMMQARYSNRRQPVNAEVVSNQSVASEEVRNHVLNNEHGQQDRETSAVHGTVPEEDSMPSSTSSDEEVESEFSPFTLAFASVMAAQTAGGVSSSHDRLLDSHRQTVMGSDSATQTHGVLDGQLADSQRKSIAEIIAQNRKEIQRVKEIKNKLLHSMKKNDSRSRLLFVTSTSSDTDSEQESAGEKPSQSVSHDKEKDTSTDAKKSNNSVKCHLKRLRDLRNEALETDSGSSDPGSGGSKKVKVDEDTSPVIPGTSNSCRDINGSRLGPYIHEIDLNHSAACSESNSVDSQCNFAGMPSTVGNCDSNTPDANNDHSNASGNQINANTVSSETQTKVSSSDTSAVDPSTSNSDITTTSESFDKKINKSKTNTSISENKQPVWSEFKRFKNKVERARRYYRRHTSSDDDTQ